MMSYTMTIALDLYRFDEIHDISCSDVLPETNSFHKPDEKNETIICTFRFS